MEIAYSRFERTVELPCQLAQPRVTLEARDGLFIVRITEA
jgi:HSP20 family molecular chaperone IbpA